MSQDIIYAVSRGKIRPTKHVTVGLAIKSLTNSKKVINILNRYGQICSYSTLGGLETEATYSASSETDICPPKIRRVTNLSTGLAYDNFDRFVDTPTGKDTLHDTVGIIYQFIDHSLEDSDISLQSSVEESLQSSIEDSNSSNEGTNVRRKKRRRAFDSITLDLENVNKKPKILECLLPFDLPERSSRPSNLVPLKQINYAWFLSHFLRIQNTPMWVGFNSFLH